MPTIQQIQTFFIVGLPRSGTTLLEQMLDQHSRIKVCPEMATGVVLWRLNAFKKIKDKWKHLLLLNYIYDRASYFKTSMTDLLAIQANRRFHFPIETSFWFSPIIMDFVNQKTADLYAEKTPENLTYIKELKQAFPGSKFIILMRHPIDVIYSIYENSEFINGSGISQKDMLKLVMPIIKRDLNTILHYKRNKLTDLAFVKYEDLIQEPFVVLKSICNFLEIQFESQMLAYQNKKEFSERGKNMQKIHSLLNEPMHINRINRSFHLMKPAELLFLNEYLKDELKMLDYHSAPTVFPLSRRMRTRIVLAKLKYQLKLDLIDGLWRKFRFQLHYFLLSNLRWQPLLSRLTKRFVFK